MKTIPTELDPWWRLPSRTLCLLALGAALSLVCTIQPSLIESALWLADFRQWPWWYFALLLVVFVFSLRWYSLYSSAGESDDIRNGESVRFVRLTGTLSVLFFLTAVFHRLGWLRFFRGALWLWFGFGSFSFAALLAFTCIMTIVALTVTLVWQWIRSWEK